jgi:hypothetical protein
LVFRIVAATAKIEKATRSNTTQITPGVRKLMGCSGVIEGAFSGTDTYKY